jgi:imidazolonepropionase-like amidohydrolase
LARKPDFVKIWFIRSKGDDLKAEEEIVKAVAATAHAAGVRLAVHATQLETAKAALRDGADVLVHAVDDAPVDAEFIALAKQRHALYIPTLVVTPNYSLALSGTWKPTEPETRLADPEILGAMNDLAKLPGAELPEWPRKLIERSQTTRPMHPFSPTKWAMRNLRTLWDAGIAVAMGTDAGNIGTLHGPSVFAELDEMEHAGLTPQEALFSATVQGARMLGMEKDLGTLAVGKLADLVVIDADPLVHVANASQVYRVVHNGQLFDPKALVDSIRPH